MILLQILPDLMEDVSADMTNGQAGTDSTLFNKTQSGLQSAVGATDIALTDKTFTNSSISVSHVIPTTTGNSNDLVEYEINDGGSNSYNRVVKATTSKTDEIELTTSFTITFEVII